MQLKYLSFVDNNNHNHDYEIRRIVLTNIAHL